jgi:hypothetical protein
MNKDENNIYHESPVRTVESMLEPTEFIKEWKYKTENLLILAHIKQQGNLDDKEIGKSWTLLAKGILDACKIIERLNTEIKTRDELLNRVYNYTFNLNPDIKAKIEHLQDKESKNESTP